MTTTSEPEASLEIAPSKLPAYDPMRYAMEAQRAIDDLRRKTELEASLIRQIMVYRYVRRFSDRALFLVQEVRIAYGKAVLYGRKKGSKRKSQIGALTDVEITEASNTAFSPPTAP